MTKTEKEQYISELKVIGNKVEVQCSLVGCRNADLIPKEVAIDIISSTWPYNDYICESCYNRFKVAQKGYQKEGGVVK